MGTVVGQWRLRAIIILFLFYIVMYGTSALFLDIDTRSDFDEGALIEFDDSDVEGLDGTDEDLEISGKDEGDDFIGMLTGMFDFLTFGNVDNAFARLLLTTVMGITTIATVYIIYTFIKEWIPLT